MGFVAIVLLLIFDVILCIVEIPQMKKNDLKKEKWTFVIILGLGNILVILKSLGKEIPNPSEWVIAFYAPAVNLMQNVFK